MRICHVTCVHSRYDNRILKKECVSLAKAGYDTYLVVNDSNTDETYQGVRIVSTGKSYSGRCQRILRSSREVLKKALKIDAEVYHLHDPELLSIIGVLQKKGKRVIFDAHEDTEEQIKDKDWIPKILRKPISKVYGAYVCKKFKEIYGIVTVTPQFGDKFAKLNENVVVVTNYPIINEENTSAEIQLGGYVFFAGGVSEQWCIETIAKAVNDSEKIDFLFAGPGNREYINKICSMGAHIRYLGMLQHNEVMKYYAGSMAGMAILDCTQVGREGTLGNTKLFEIMLAGKPVVCSDLRLWKQLINKHQCGICVDAKDIDGIRDALECIRDNPEAALAMGTNGKNAVVKEYNWGTQELILTGFYGELERELECYE